MIRLIILVVYLNMHLLMNAQYVGIGTTNPQAPFHVLSTTNANIMRLEAASSMYVSLYESGVYRGYLGSYAGAPEDVDLGTGSGNLTGKLHLTIQANPKLTIRADGNVGIGITDPTARLHVAGGIKINSNNTLEFGSGIVKEVNAGKIGYQAFSVDALDIVGAGTAFANRRIRFFAEGGSDFDGNVNVSTGKITGDATGTVNIVPIAYANFSNTGAVLSGTGNISAAVVTPGNVYDISVSGKTLSQSNTTFVITITNDGQGTVNYHGFFDSGNIRVVLSRSSPGYLRDFSIIIYQQ